MIAYIVTGASRGLGEAICKQVLHTDNVVFAIARSANPELESLAQSATCDFHYYSFDLNEVDRIQELMDKLFVVLESKEIDQIALINNAGVLDPMLPVEKLEADDLQKHMNINLIAPMLLSKAFVKHTLAWQCEKTIFNISSGAAHNPYHGWAAYCSSKAGLNMFTQVLAEEQFAAINPVKVIAFAPGVVETNMQKQIRAVEEEDFLKKEKFVNLKESGSLLVADDVAKVITQNLFNPDFPQGAIIDVREMHLE